MKKLLSSVYEINGKSELSVWIEGEENKAMLFEVVDGKIKRKELVGEHLKKLN